MIIKCLGNDRAAQEKLYRKFYPALFLLCRKFFKDENDALEALNDGMLRVFKHIGQYNNTIGEFFNWMYTVVRNAALDKLKHNYTYMPAEETPSGKHQQYKSDQQDSLFSDEKEVKSPVSISDKEKGEQKEQITALVDESDQQDPLFSDEKGVKSPVLISDKIKGKPKEQAFKSINRKIKLASKATNKDAQPASLSGKSKASYGTRLSTKENKQAAIDLAILPLHRENMKALVHHDMQVSYYPESNRKKDPSNKWSVWLQLNVPAPLYGTKYYTTGPKGNDAFYRNLIPSLRLERATGKSALSIDLHPYNAIVLPVKRGFQSSENIWSNNLALRC